MFAFKARRFEGKAGVFAIKAANIEPAAIVFALHVTRHRSHVTFCGISPVTRHMFALYESAVVGDSSLSPENLSF